MAIINCKDILLTVPGNALLINTDLSIVEGSKYALIGYNGSGKTTLLRRIQQKYWEIDKNLDVFYVEQEVKADQNTTVFQITYNIL